MMDAAVFSLQVALLGGAFMVAAIAAYAVQRLADWLEQDDSMTESWQVPTRYDEYVSAYVRALHANGGVEPTTQQIWEELGL